MRNKDHYRVIIPILLILALLAVGISVYLTMREDERPAKNNITETPAVTDSAGYAAEIGAFEAIITGIDLDSLTLTAVRLGGNEDEEFTYTGATSIMTRFDRPITAALLKVGDFVQLSFKEGNVLSGIYELKDIEVYSKILNPVIEAEPKRITVADEVYRYDDNLLILNDGFFVSMDTLVSSDILTAYSRDGFIYMLEVFSGHGYLTLENCEGFYGGSISIAHEGDFEITDKFSRTLPEGEYSVKFTNGEIGGNETVLISRDRTSTIDLSVYLPDPEKFATVKFTINPSDAFLYIDGLMKNHAASVSVAFGEHRIDVIADGYTPYEGTIDVTRSYSTLSVTLPTLPVKEPEEAPDSTDNVSPIAPTQAANEPVSVPDYPDIPDSTSDIGDDIDLPEPDDEVTPTQEEIPTGRLMMIIHCSDGASVFINDVYKGDIEDGELSFDKPEGTVNVRITKEGYITKYYTVTVDDDDEDAEFTFPAMVPLG